MIIGGPSLPDWLARGTRHSALGTTMHRQGLISLKFAGRVTLRQPDLRNWKKMNIGTQIDGERIAKDVIAQTLALEAISKRPRNFSPWNYGLSLLFGSAWGVFIASYTGPHAQLILGSASGIAVILSITTFWECLRLRRRLDAAIVLLLKREDLPFAAPEVPVSRRASEVA